MKRIIMDELIKWKASNNRKPLLLTGVRQCGKNYIIKQFGEENFEEITYLNLEQNPKIASVFDEDYNPKRIISDLGNIFLNKTINPGKTLLILDEIQMAPKAIAALKYLRTFQNYTLLVQGLCWV